MSDLRFYFRKRIDENKKNNQNYCIRINHIRFRENK